MDEQDATETTEAPPETAGPIKKAGKRKRARPASADLSLWLSTLPRVGHYVRPFWKLTAASTAITLASAVLQLGKPWPIAIVFDGVLGDKKSGGLLGIARSLVGSGKYALLICAVSAVFAFALLEGALTLLNRYVDTKLKLGMVLEMQSDLFQHTQRLSLTYHNQARLGALMNKVNNAPNALGDIVTAAPPLVQSVLTLFGMLTIAILVDWQVALAALIVAPLLYYQVRHYGKHVIPRLREAGRLELEAISIVNEALQMIRLIVTFGRERHEFGRFRTQSEIANEARLKVTVRQMLFSLGIDAATALGTALVLGLGAWHVIQGRLSTGQLVVLMSYIAAVYQPLQTITSSANSLGQNIISLSFSTEVLDEDPEVSERPDARELERADGRVAFDDVTFIYPGRKRTLENVAFEAEPGQRIAVVGQTGSGKSTLASLLVRFYDPDQGRILIDGVDIRELTLRSLREQIGLVLQEPLLFSGTIEDNIRYGRLEATQEQIVAAARAANAHDFIEALPNGYTTVLGERGPQLSGGEKQRICVARAFLKDAPILILDEPTSSIDSKTESGILASLDDLMVGRTSFMIAHRLSTIRSADLILVMKRGKIVDRGTHEQLIARSDIYRELHAVSKSQATLEVAVAGAHGQLFERLMNVMAQPEEKVRRRVRRLAAQHLRPTKERSTSDNVVPLQPRPKSDREVG